MARRRIKRDELDRRLRELAAREDDVVSRPELLAIGMSDRLIATFRRRLQWQQPQQGVFVIGAAPPTWHQLCRAALKAGGDAVVLAAETGLAAWGVEGARQAKIHVQAQRPSNPRLRDVVTHRTTVPDKPRRTADGLRTSSIERLLIDFAAYGPVERVEQAVESSLVQGLTSERRLWEAVARNNWRMPGIARLNRVLVERPEGKAARSVLEIQIFKVLGRAGLPLPTRNCNVAVDDKNYEIDCAYVDAMGAIECDSRRWHSTSSQRRKDRERQTALEAAGWSFVRVTYADVFGRPDWVVEQVRNMLADAEMDRGGAKPGQRPA